MKRRYVVVCVCVCGLVGTAACQIAGNSYSMSTTSFTLTFQEHKGLDCFMANDCGYKVEVASSGTAKYYKDSGDGPVELQDERAVAQDDVDALTRILDEQAFRTMPEQVPVFSEEDVSNPPVMGAGTITISITSGSDVQTVRVLKGNPLPENARLLLDNLRPALLALFE